jgi:hypothetical protein
MPTDERRVAALKRERAGLVQRGLDERIAQVDEEIKAYGGEVPGSETKEPAAPEPKTTAAGRGRKPQATAD